MLALILLGQDTYQSFTFTGNMFEFRALGFPATAPYAVWRAGEDRETGPFPERPRPGSGDWKRERQPLSEEKDCLSTPTLKHFQDRV